MARLYRPARGAFAYAVAPFEIASGDAQSVVIHALPTEEGTGLPAPAWPACP